MVIHLIKNSHFGKGANMKFKLVSYVYYGLLSLYAIFILLMSFVIPNGGFIVGDLNIDDVIDDINQTASLSYPETLSPVLQDATVLGYYENDYQLITIYQFKMFESNVFVADIVVRSPKVIISALAHNRFGGYNYVQTTSQMAQDHNAVFAINADYASHYDSGIVIKNGSILRESQSYRDAIALFDDGTVSSFAEEETTAQNLKAMGAWQVWSFGPVLIKNGKSVASVNDGLQRSAVDNPRSGFGWVGDLHYRFVTVDGRTDISRGVDIEEFALIMQYLETKEAYNFDGGGSATMYFDGQLVNVPSNGAEREVGDCVYLIY